MSVTFHLPSVLAAHVGGTRTIEADGATVGRAVDDLVARHPQLLPRLKDAQGAPYAFVTFYLNDEDVRLVGGFDAPTTDGDEVTIVPAVAGG
jgi:sulfur-carrier protein